jgi:hypothetical protein
MRPTAWCVSEATKLWTGIEAEATVDPLAERCHSRCPGKISGYLDNFLPVVNVLPLLFSAATGGMFHVCS